MLGDDGKPLRFADQAAAREALRELRLERRIQVPAAPGSYEVHDVRVVELDDE